MASFYMKSVRKQFGLTQAEMAEKLGVSQPYLSLLEKGRRTLPPKLAHKAVRVLGVSPTVLPPREVGQRQVSADRLAREVAALGYPGFSHLRKGWRRNPAEVLLAALSQKNLEARLTEALPWLLLNYSDLDREWLVREARLRNLTNRLGFVVSLACQVAEKRGNGNRQSLQELLDELRTSKLALEEPFGQDATGESEQQWLRANRPEEAKYWNLLTDWTPEMLRYA
jgi:transcriptional regulator with XRE-family HTH domain